MILLLSWGGNPADTLPHGRTRCLPYCKQTTALTAHPKFDAEGCNAAGPHPAVSTLLAILSSSKPFPISPCQGTCCVLDAEDCCCFPLECLLLPLQKSLEALKCSQGHFHTRGYRTHRVRQPLADESGTSLATVEVWGEMHFSQLVLAPMRARA